MTFYGVRKSFTWKIRCSIFFILGLILFFALAFVSNALDEESTSVTLSNFKLPEYNKESKKLEFIVYGEKAETIGVQINLTTVKIEWVNNDINHVKATISSPEAVYDKVTKIIKGDKDVHFRSPEMDADGIGFDADYQKQTIHIRSNVKVFLKQHLQETEQKNERKTEQ